jgi:hypothetical protein
MKSASVKLSAIKIKDGNVTIPSNNVDLLNLLIKNKQPSISSPFGDINIDDIGVAADGSVIFKNAILKEKIQEAKKKTPSAELNIGSCKETITVNGAC